MLVAFSLSPASADEFRAAWADVFHVGMGSQSEVNTMVSSLVAGHYNAVVVQVVAYMDSGTASHGAQYKSTILPWSTRVTASFDPLAYLCAQAHANGIEVHAWLGGSGGAMYRVSTSWPPASNPTLASHPEWFMAPITNSEANAIAPIDGIYILDMGSPEAQEYVVSLVRELVTNYAIDGINWDDEINGNGYNSGYGYPAYSQAYYPRSGLARYRINTGATGTPSNTDTAWANYRRRFKNELMARVQAEIQSIKTNPRQPLRHTSAALAYSPVPSTCDFTGSTPYLYFCDWAGMLQHGWVDAVIPQTYSSSTFNTWADRCSSCWQYSRNIFPGIGAYLNTDATIASEINYTRSKGLLGNSIYSYAVPNSAGNSDWWAYAAANVYTNIVSTPPMPWRNPATATEGIVWGRVKDANTGLYVDDATVTVTGGPTVKTDGNGYYVATLVPATVGGTAHSTTVSKAGMIPQTTNAIALAGDIVRYDLMLNGSTPPDITMQPQSQDIGLGADATFTVVATGTDPLSYQWRRNETNVDGATASSYTRTNVQPADAGSYTVVITNSVGSITSSNAVLIVETNINPPAFSLQPQGQTVIAGQSATFTAAATGTAPLRYQWRFNAATITGATNSAYTRTNAQLADAGSYSVTVTNGAGGTNSGDAVLTVNFGLAVAGTLGGTVSKTPDQPSYAPNTIVTLSATADTNHVFIGWSGDATGTNNPLPVTMTTNKSVSATFASTATEIVIDNSDPGWTDTSPSGSWTVGSSSAVPKIGSNYLYTAGTGGASITRSCRWTPTIGTPGFYDVYVYYQIGANRTAGATYRVTYYNGTVSSLQNQYSTTPNQADWFLVGTNLRFASGTGGYVALGNDAVDTALVSADAAKFVLVTPITAPVITAQPQGLNVTAGSNATFAVTATGTAPLGYQWRFNGTNLANGTASIYTRTNAQSSDAGSYSVVVSNLAGIKPSDDALLVVSQPSPPQIDSISVMSSGQIQLQVSCTPGHYAVDATTNLADWAELSNFTTTGSGFQYLDSETNLVQRFYRVRLMP